MDECRIWVGRNFQSKMMAWSHRGDCEGQPPISNQLLGHHQEFKGNLLLVVNAYWGWFGRSFSVAQQGWLMMRGITLKCWKS
jgi:hypothetical protein